MSNYTLGLDLGQSRDYSALAVIERAQAFDTREEEGFERGPWRADGGYWSDGRRVFDLYFVRALRRWPLGTSYTQVVDDVSDVMSDPGLRRCAVLCLDYGGVGAPVEDLFIDCYRNGRLGDRWPVRVTLSAGFASADSRGTSDHKGDVIAKLLAASQRGRVTIPAEMPLARALEKELRAFTLKQTKAGNVRFEARHESDHDDLLLAVALGVWHRHGHGEPRFVGEDGQLRERDSAIATNP